MALDPESESTNIEYKRKLVCNYSEKRLNNLANQMNRRIMAGIELHNSPEAIYMIGVDDNGKISNISESDMETSINTFRMIANLAKVNITKIKTIKTESGIYSKVYINKFNKIDDIRIIIIGPEKSGKSTILQTLTNSNMKTGKTRHIKQDYMLYENDELINISEDNVAPISDIISNCNKIVNIIDTPGKSKYFNIIIKTIFSYFPDHVFITFDNESNFYEVYKYIRLIEFLNIDYTILFTKFSSYKNNYIFNNYIPLNSIDNIGYPELHNIIKNIERKNSNNNDNSVRFIVNGVINNDSYNNIIHGILINGKINRGDRLLIGPFKNNFYEIVIKSIHRNRILCKEINYMEQASMSLEIFDKNIIIKDDMVITDIDSVNNFTSSFYFKIISNTNIKIEKYMKLSVFIDNIFKKIQITQILTVNGTFYYKCESKHKFYINDNMNMGIKYNKDIIQTIVYKNIN